MSDPVKNVEIEDVLSSIRRLVSEDNRPAPRQPQTAEVARDRLVLTPALRVAADRAAEPPIHSDYPVHSDDVGKDADQDTAAAMAEMVEPEPETSSVEPFDRGALDLGGMQVPEMIEEDWEDGAAIEDAAGAPRSEDGWPEAEPDEALAEPTEASAEEDFTQAGTQETAEQDGSAPWTDPDATLYAAADGAADGMSDEPEPAADENMSEPKAVTTLSDKIAALEAVIGRTDDQWEPDGRSQDDYAGTDVETLEWEDARPDEPEDMQADREPEAVPEPEPEPEPEDALHEAAPELHQQADSSPEPDSEPAPARPEVEAGTASEGLTLDDAILDEEMLRNLIAEIVREELQGSLGERITRNVRKLVRREIHRALTVQELE